MAYAPPPGFETLDVSPATVILRTDRREALLRLGIQDPETLSERGEIEGRLVGGRTPHGILRLDEDRCVLKEYRRGGMLGRWNRTRYWGRARFLREMDAALAAAEAQVPTADVLALVLRPAGLGSVRVWLVTRFVEGARPITDFLGGPEESAAYRAAGRAVAAMHGAGIDHPDLHLGNVLGVAEPGGCRALIVDWDRARRRAPGTWNPSTNLLRLWRSVKKGLQTGRIVVPTGAPKVAIAPLLAFSRGYFGGDLEMLRRTKVYVRRRTWTFGPRSLFWPGR